MRVVDGEVHVGDVLTYDCRIVRGYGAEYQVQATVLDVKGDRARIAYQKRSGGIVRRWVWRNFLYKSA